MEPNLEEVCGRWRGHALGRVRGSRHVIVEFIEVLGRRPTRRPFRTVPCLRKVARRRQESAVLRNESLGLEEILLFLLIAHRTVCSFFDSKGTAKKRKKDLQKKKKKKEAMSFGSKETEKLRANIESQLNRLLAQLQDLDDLKDVCF